MTPPFEIKRGADMADAAFAVLLQGRQKTRKTTCALTFPDPFVISVDPNRSPLAFFPDAQVVIPKDVATVEREILPALQAGKVDAGTVVLDSFSFFSDLWADRVMGTATSYGRGQGQASGVTLRRFLLQLIELKIAARPYNLVITVHESLRSEGEDGPKRIEPHTIGALRESLGKFFDLVLLLEMANRTVTEGGRSRVETVCLGHSVSPDKFRSAGGSLWGRHMPPTIENPSYQTLRAAVGLPVDYEPRRLDQAPSGASSASNPK